MKKKFKLTSNTKTEDGIKFYQIKALTSFSIVIKGEFGGWVEKEENLSQEGNAWVYGNARVFDNAQVYGDAWVYGNAQVSGKFKLSTGFLF